MRKYILPIVCFLLVAVFYFAQLYVAYITGESYGLAEGYQNGFEAGREYEREHLIDKCNLDKDSWCLR